MEDGKSKEKEEEPEEAKEQETKSEKAKEMKDEEGKAAAEEDLSFMKQMAHERFDGHINDLRPFINHVMLSHVDEASRDKSINDKGSTTTTKKKRTAKKKFPSSSSEWRVSHTEEGVVCLVKKHGGAEGKPIYAGIGIIPGVSPAEVSAFVQNQPKKYQEDLDFDATPERPLKQIGKHTQLRYFRTTAKGPGGFVSPRECFVVMSTTHVSPSPDTTQDDGDVGQERVIRTEGERQGRHRGSDHQGTTPPSSSSSSSSLSSSLSSSEPESEARVGVRSSASSSSSSSDARVLSAIPNTKTPLASASDTAKNIKIVSFSPRSLDGLLSRSETEEVATDGNAVRMRICAGSGLLLLSLRGKAEEQDGDDGDGTASASSIATARSKESTLVLQVTEADYLLPDWIMNTVIRSEGMRVRDMRTALLK